MSQVICAPQGNKTACDADQTLQDTQHHMYQLVYIASMVSVLTFGIIKGFTFTNTTLMASSSLHNRVFNKVVAQRAAGPYTVPNTVSDAGDGTALLESARCSQGTFHLFEHHAGRPVSGSNRDTS